MELVGEDRPAAVRWTVCLGAVALGASVPSLMLGRAGMAVVAGIAVIALIATADRKSLNQDLGAALRSPLGIAVAITFALWLVSTAGSIDVVRSAGIWLRMAALLLAGAALVSVLRRDPHLHALALKALVVAAVIGAVLALITVLVWADPYFLLRSDGGNADLLQAAALRLKSYGAAVACAMPVVLWAGWRLAPGWRVPAVAYQILAVGLMIAVEFRSGMLAAALGAGVLACWLTLRNGRLWLVALIAAVMVAVVAVAFLTNVRGNQIEAVTAIPIWLVDAHRQAIWARGLVLAADAPVFGWGFDVIDRLPGASEIVPGSNQAYIPSHPHNWMIEVLVETGVIGFAAMVGSLVLLAWGAVRSARRDGAAGATLLALLAAFFFISSISFSFWSYWWQATFVLLACLAVAVMTPGSLSAGFGPAGRRA
jgi:O-antigen ligase